MSTQTGTINPTAKWYVSLCSRFNELMDRNGIPEEISSEVKLFVIDIAKEQYRSGSKSGAAWMQDKLLGKKKA